MTNEQSTIDLHQYWEIIRRRKLAIIIPTLLALGLAAAYVFVVQKPQYTAQAKVLVNPIVTPSTSNANAKGNTVDMNTEQAAAGSGPVALRARKALGLSSANGDRLLSHLNVNVSGTANVLQFQYTSPDPQQAGRYANAFALAYIAYRNSTAQAPINAAIKENKSNSAYLMSQVPKAGKVQRGVMVLELRANANQLAQFQADQKLISAGTVITTAGTPSSPSSPKVVKTLLIAGVLGLVIGLGLALIREALDGRIRDADALESRLRAPVLGVIPSFNARSPEKSLATVTDPRGAASDAYRMAGITLEQLAARDGLRVMMVASPADGGGASTSVANLGVVLAQAGHRVILVSADLRYPTLQLIFGLSNGHGFCNALMEGMDPERLLKETQVPNLYVMTSGP
ncbi:MAG TPA: Wzz/FepE/Etk N-terminal domain-containing protein, partial [Gemmatimonadales bacterium]|nr:Wzz/FepE/Etk N-terminal domain-containing protein [Gemmatimonadales bacterium]